MSTVGIENYHLYNINLPKKAKSWMHKTNKISDAFNTQILCIHYA